MQQSGPIKETVFPSIPKQKQNNELSHESKKKKTHSKKEKNTDCIGNRARSVSETGGTWSMDTVLPNDLPFFVVSSSKVMPVWQQHDQGSRRKRPKRRKNSLQRQTRGNESELVALFRCIGLLWQKSNKKTKHSTCPYMCLRTVRETHGVITETERIFEPDGKEHSPQHNPIQVRFQGKHLFMPEILLLSAYGRKIIIVLCWAEKRATGGSMVMRWSEEFQTIHRHFRHDKFRRSKRWRTDVAFFVCLMCI